MNGLSVFEDYTQCMAFLRASRNRLFNTLETAKMIPDHAATCRKFCERLYDHHARIGIDVIDSLNNAIVQKDRALATTAANRLHKHNRQTARLSRLFEEDVSDDHPDPEADPPDTPKPIDVSTPIQCNKFMAKLRSMDAEMQKAVAVAARPKTPKQ